MFSLIIKSIETPKRITAAYNHKMRRMNNLVTLFTAMIAFFFGALISSMLNGSEKCLNHKSGVVKLEPHPDIFLIVLVFSAPQNEERRQAIRETWYKLGQPLMHPYYPEEFIYVPHYDRSGHLQLETVAEQANKLRIYTDWLDSLGRNSEDTIKEHRKIKIKHFFAIGVEAMNIDLRMHLEKEHKKHNDLLILPKLVDSYANLTEKLLHSIEALTHSYNFSYILKADDDSYVKMDYLLNELVSYDRKLIRKTSEYRNDPMPQLYWGYFNGRANIKSKGQWAEPNYYLSQRYITYAFGGGYVISRKICEFIAANARHLTPYVSEDVSLGVWLAPLRYVYRRHDPRFDTAYFPRKCRTYHIILHKITIELMQDLYDHKLCSFETQNESKFKRPIAYYYDWRKSSDKCCDSIVV